MESARCKWNRCCRVVWLHTHKLLQAPYGEAIDPVEGETVACGGPFQLLGSDFAGL